MMRKKILSYLTALCVITGTMAAMPVAAEELSSQATAVVVAIDESSKDCVIRLADEALSVHGFIYLDAERDLVHLDDAAKTLEYGDVLKLVGDFGFTESRGTNAINYTFEEGEPPKMNITVVGSIFDDEQLPNTFEVTENVQNMSYPYCWFEKESTTYYYDFLLQNSGYTQPSGIDWTTVKSGDKVTFYTYKGVPMLPTSVAYAGDANADGGVTIADVIFLNRQILGDTGLARTTFNQALADYDANGIIDAADSLMILKRIVELI